MMKIHHIIPVALLSQLVSSPAAPNAIETPDLRVESTLVDGNAVFSITGKSSGRVIVRNGTLFPGSKIEREPSSGVTSDPVFGSGKRLTFPFENGSVAIDLYPSLPFALIRPQLKNTQDADIDEATKVIATFTYDSETPATSLRTMGTGGLLAADKNPGSYLFLACADPATRHGLVTGWLSQNRGSGTVFSAVTGDDVEIKAQLEHGHLILKPGQSATLDTFAIGYFPDARIGLEQYADAVKDFNNIRIRPKSAVYCTWYAEGKDHGLAGTAASTLELSKFVREQHLKEYGLDVIQIDDRWQNGPNIQGPATDFSRVKPDGPYKNGIAPVARQVRADGLTFGLWWLPFGRNHMQPEFSEKQDWFVKQSDGSPLRQKSFGGTCLDSTNPEVREHLKSLSKQMADWGVEYFKMDGLSTGAGVDHVYINDAYKNDRLSDCLPLYDPSKTNIEALRLGLKTIRDGAGGNVFFSGCCAVQNMRIYAGSIGLVDSMRVGPDFNHDGQGIRSGPLRGSRVYFMNGKIWWNDPDPTKVRSSDARSDGDNSATGAVTTEQARLTSSWVSLTNQFFLISDWLPDLPAERLEILKRTMSPHHGTARPVDYFDNELANTWRVSDTKSGVHRNVIGVFNFHPQQLKLDQKIERLGLDPDKTYHAFDFWADKLLPDIKGSFQSDLAPNSCQVVSLRADEGHPVLLSTSRHVTQGIVDVTAENWSANTLSGTSTIISNDPYELRVRIPDGWVFESASATPASKAKDQSVSVIPTVTPGLVRLAIRYESSPDVPVNWSVKFKR